MHAMPQMEASCKDFALPLEAKFRADMILLPRMVTYVSNMDCPVVRNSKQAKS